MEYLDKKVLVKTPGKQLTFLQLKADMLIKRNVVVDPDADADDFGGAPAKSPKLKPPAKPPATPSRSRKLTKFETALTEWQNLHDRAQRAADDYDIAANARDDVSKQLKQAIKDVNKAGDDDEKQDAALEAKKKLRS